jgi:hypothetical protein
MAAIIDAWAAVWLLVASAVAIAGLRRARRLPTAAWLVSIGGFLAVQEDPLLIIQMASSKPRSGLRGGMLGLVTRTPGHTRTACLPGPRRGGCCSGHRPVRAAPQRGVGMVGARRILAAGKRPHASTRCSGCIRMAFRWPALPPTGSGASVRPRWQHGS